jgi:hypothetical protein
MGRVCNMYGGEERSIQGVGADTWRNLAVVCHDAYVWKGFDRSQNKPLMWILFYGNIIFDLWNCTEGLLLHLKYG